MGFRLRGDWQSFSSRCDCVSGIRPPDLSGTGNYEREAEIEQMVELFNIKFVGEVEKRPELYDYTLQQYSRKDCTEKAWNEIAKEVNLSAGACKEKWRNLRSTLVKNIKPKLSGRGVMKKKPYYLTDAMQFALPFLKVACTPTRNLPERSASSRTPDDSEISVTNEETIFSEDMFSASRVPKTENLSDHLPASLPPSPRPPSTTSQPATTTRDSLTTPEPTGTVTQVPGGQAIRMKKHRNIIQNDDDEAFSQYCSAKAAKITNTSTPSALEKREGIKNFLDSLIPDLMQMNDVQLRIYKRRALLLIDEIMETAPEML